MANNRLYIVDTETDEKFLLAKSFGQWKFYHDTEALNLWLKDRDCGATTGNEPTKLKLETE